MQTLTQKIYKTWHKNRANISISFLFLFTMGASVKRVMSLKATVLTGNSSYKWRCSFHSSFFFHQFFHASITHFLTHFICIRPCSYAFSTHNYLPKPFFSISIKSFFACMASSKATSFLSKIIVISCCFFLSNVLSSISGISISISFITSTVTRLF